MEEEHALLLAALQGGTGLSLPAIPNQAVGQAVANPPVSTSYRQREATTYRGVTRTSGTTSG